MAAKPKRKVKKPPAAPGSPKPGKRDAAKERTKRKILRAAMELFRKRGFYQTTTRQISRKAGIAEGTLFNYFRTKEDLALYFFAREVDELIEWRRDNAALREQPVAEAIFAVIHRHLERIESQEEFIGAVYLRALQPASKLNPASLEAQEVNLRYLRFIRELLDDAEKRGEIPSVGDFGAYAVGLFHLAMITYWLHDASPGKEDTLAALDRSLKLAASLLKNGGWEW